ncbi:MAG: aminoglycoside phosphotransferase family protein [Ilumatobacteraceae bacterium]
MADRPFVIEPPGDIGVVEALAARAARAWSLPQPELLRVGMNALFAAGDDVVLRIGRPTADPAAALWLADQLAAHGVRVPSFLGHEPLVEGPLVVYAVTREHATGPTDWAAVGAMVRRVHQLDPATIAARYPTPPCWSFPWWDFGVLMADVAPMLDEPARCGIERAIARHAGWQDRVGPPPVVLHGDVHPGNVIQTADGPVLLDWDLVCTGPAAWDHGPLMTWTERWGGEPGVYEDFAAGYGTSLRGDPVAEAVAELRLVAATLMRVRAGRTSPDVAAEAERRLQWWRGDPDAPTWRAA